MRKKQLTNQQIQREQLQLVKIQKELEDVLVKVNEGINALKVEELQLRSIVPTNRKETQQSNSDGNLLHAFIEPSGSGSEEITINAQSIDLETPLVRHEMEEEEDDD